MAKAKMAVRNKQKSNQFKLDLKMPTTKAPLLRLLGAVMMASTLVFVIFLASNTWQVTWPVNEVALQGNTQFVTTETINQFMQQQPKAGLLAIDLEELQLKAKKISWVRNVEIRKVWPDKLIFTIDEHQPVALFGTSVLTQHGKLIQINESEVFSHLPQIDLAKQLDLKKIKHAEIWLEYKEIKRDLELINLSLKRLEIDQVNNWKLSFLNGLTLNVGRKNRTKRVKRFLDVFAIIENNKQLKTVDLRYHNGLAVEWLEQNVLQQQKLKLKS